MQYQVADILDHLGDLVQGMVGTDEYFKSIDSDAEFNRESLIFLSEPSASLSPASVADDVWPAVVITNPTLAQEFQQSPTSQVKCLISVSNVRLALALCKQRFDDYDAADTEWAAIHPSAIIHATARIGDGVRIGPNSVIGAGVEIANHVQIRANCVIEHGAYVGHNSVLHPMVNIGYNCVIGERVIIRPGAIIGNEGFGFAQDEQRAYHRIPHTGIVHIGDDVQIGSNSNIDRGTYGVTRIARGVKIDALCHIAHNVTVNEDALFVAQCGVAGSSNIGKRAILSGQTGVLDHRTIVDDAVLVHRCGVTADVLEPGVWAGIPPKPFKDYVRDINLAKKVARLEKSIKQLTP